MKTKEPFAKNKSAQRTLIIVLGAQASLAAGAPMAKHGHRPVVAHGSALFLAAQAKRAARARVLASSAVSDRSLSGHLYAQATTNSGLPTTVAAATASPPSGGSASANFTSTITGGGLTPSSAAEVARVIGIAIADPRIKVDVAALPNNTYVCVLSGTIHPSEKPAFENTVKDLKALAIPIVHVLYTGDSTLKQVQAKKDPPESTEVWPLTFVPGALGALEVPDQYQVSPVIDALNKIYAKDATSPPPIQKARQSLVLRGTKDLRADIKRQLVLLDTPGPQVQLDIWALQVSGKRSPGLQETLQRNADLTRDVQNVLKRVPDDLNGAIALGSGYDLRDSDPSTVLPPPYLDIPTPGLKAPPAPEPIENESAERFRRRWYYWQDHRLTDMARRDLAMLRVDPEPRGSATLNSCLIALALQDRAARNETLNFVEMALHQKLLQLDPQLRTAIGAQVVTTRLTALRDCFLVPPRLDNDKDNIDYWLPLTIEHEGIRNFLEAVVAYRATQNGKEGMAGYAKRLDRKLTEVTADRNLQFLPDYRLLAADWAAALADRAGEDAAKKDPRYLTNLKSAITATDKNFVKKTHDDWLAELLTKKFGGRVPTDEEKATVEQSDEFVSAFIEKLEAFGTASKDASLAKTRRTIFLEAETASILDHAPEDLRRTSAVTDSLLKKAVDAFTEDMQDILLRPLVRHLIDGGNNGRGASGVSLIGRTRLVATSGLQSRLTPQLVAYADATRPSPLSAETLNMAFPGAKSQSEGASSSTAVDADGKVTSTSGNQSSNSSGFKDLTGAAQVLAGLNPAQAILLAGALTPPTPVFAKVAPGVTIAVRPSVMPDGASARLQIEASFGVDATVDPPANAKNILTWPAADSVKAHSMGTDAIVSAYDLFDISSFDLSTSYPRPPGYIPVLGTLPIVGPAFQWRRKNTQIDHHSTILVNTVILPRSLDLVQLFGNVAP